VKLGEAIATVLKAEGVDILTGYPVNHLIEFAAALDIRPIMVRQERIGLHMADAISRVTSGDQVGVFCMQHGPGAENAFGGVAQCFGESVPVLVVPMGYPRRIAGIEPNFSSVRSMASVTKRAETITMPAEVGNVMRRAFAALRGGRGGPALVEVPADIWNEDVGEFSYAPVPRVRSAPDPADIDRAAALLQGAKRPVIYAGTGIHWAKAWRQLRALAERLAAPVATSLGGKSAFDETHPLALGALGLAVRGEAMHMLRAADVILGIGCSFTETNFGQRMPTGPKVIHATLDPMHLHKDQRCEVGIAGDAALTLDALLAALPTKARDAAPVAAEIVAARAPWQAKWQAKLDSTDAPLSPYRVIRDLLATVDVGNTIVTHDAGSPRDQISPFWQSTAPLSYLGWGKTTQLGYGLGLAMGAKLARPEALCINVWGDAAIGFTGMDFETCVRERIPILSVLLNNFCMAIELKVMPVSTARYNSTDISGDYAAMARAFGGFGERVERPEDIVPAIRRGIAATQAGQPALLEFITTKETAVSRP
jgi:acetolactate synthase-1/2/3 large subunit